MQKVKNIIKALFANINSQIVFLEVGQLNDLLMLKILSQIAQNGSLQHKNSTSTVESRIENNMLQ